ncbi:hypothetical protein C8R46DRAFT_1067807 [Mycena filopes]|nr:hypothetical protein C8R46DRAFT_1067807 [Mycena filopes]
MNPNPTARAHNNLIWSALRRQVVKDIAHKADIVAAQDVATAFPTEVLQPLDYTMGMHVHSIQYRLAYSPPAEGGGATWKAYAMYRHLGDHESLIGYVEIDPLIYSDPGVLRDRLANGHLMLTLMATSIRDGSFIRVAHEIQPVMNPGSEVVFGYLKLTLARAQVPQTNARPAADYIVEQYDNRPVRTCGFHNCEAFIPLAGPRYCQLHRRSV